MGKLATFSAGTFLLAGEPKFPGSGAGFCKKRYCFSFIARRARRDADRFRNERLRNVLHFDVTLPRNRARASLSYVFVNTG